MGFKWQCPECGYVNEYKGKKTTNVVVRCSACKQDVKASSHIFKPTLPETTDELPETTEYKTSIKSAKSTAEIILNPILKCMARGISTIENKPAAKNPKSGYFWDLKEWKEQFEILKKLKEEVEK